MKPIKPSNWCLSAFGVGHGSFSLFNPAQISKKPGDAKSAANTIDEKVQTCSEETMIGTPTPQSEHSKLTSNNRHRFKLNTADTRLFLFLQLS